MQLEPLTLDLEGLRDCLLRKGTPRRVFFFEHSEAESTKDAMAARLGLDPVPAGAADEWERRGRREIALQRRLGHELFRVRLPNGRLSSARPAAAAGPWENEHGGPIQSWKDFDAFPWPDPAGIDFRQVEWYERELPPDMGICVTTHIWEEVRALFGFESFCYKLYEEPGLVDAVVRRVGEFNLALTRAVCDFRCAFAVYGADDLGFKTATILPPAMLRDRILVWHRRMAEHAHGRGRLYLLHTCGKVDEIMDSLIDEVQIDAKHSFEDVIEPVTEAKRRWGNRLALLGGLDVDFVARSGEAAIRRRVREVLDICQPGGGYCLGLGNWVTDYIPLDHYFAVLDEGRRYGG